MTPEFAIDRFAEIISSRAKFTDGELFDAMKKSGIPESIADRTMKFTQIAWGRIFLEGIGPQFTQDYLCFNSAGEVIESGLLTEEPYFMYATFLAKQRPPNGWLKFAVMSSDVSAFNQALKAGSKPENLVGAPAAMFMEMPTEAGLNKARQHLAKLTDK